MIHSVSYAARRGRNVPSGGFWDAITSLTHSISVPRTAEESTEAPDSPEKASESTTRQSFERRELITPLTPDKSLQRPFKDGARRR